MRASPPVHRVIKATFSLKDNSRPSNFINEVNLRAYGLTSVEKPQQILRVVALAIAALPTSVITPIAPSETIIAPLSDLGIYFLFLLLC